MRYWQFRLKVYQQTLKDWLNSLRQASAALVALFPMALPALLLLPLLALGVLADNSSSSELYYYTLWGYLLLSFGWVSMQKEAINATRYALYDRALPAGSATRRFTHAGLLLYAANVFILGPLVVLLSMFYSHFHELLSVPLAESFAQLMPITGVLVLTGYYIVIATGSRRPWLSLGLLPLALAPLAGQLSEGLCLLGYAVAICAERLIPLPPVKVSGLPVGLWRFFLQRDLHYLKPTLLRVVVVLLLLILGNIFISNINQDSQGPAGAVMAVLLAVVIASKLLELRSLQARYHYYFHSLPLNRRQQILTMLFYAGGFAAPAFGIIAYIGVLWPVHWALLLLTYTVTQVGILTKPDYYLVFPLITAILTVIAYALFF
ncbi:DUF6136 family protein [Alteromonas gilva]|uniref:DUF6136 family protein n=1 Tax=Alteromonas gilva TaxID=2987522 RepID=A0ABT5L4G5_9ALTE|nr:DUF6136 family protein [Alteromonas gilva]MDC8831748.1 DUF6136 family protein [Alteromonas gilva]